MVRVRSTRSFAAEVDETRTLQSMVSGAGSRDEFMAGMWKAIRAGSVPAMRLYWEMTKGERAASPAREEPEDALAFCDELAARRATGESRCSETERP